MTDGHAQRLEQLSAEARYHRQRLDLYRARLYGGRALSPARLEEFQRASDDAAARLRHEQEAAASTPCPSSVERAGGQHVPSRRPRRCSDGTADARAMQTPLG
jgi:hypothetical protein